MVSTAIESEKLSTEYHYPGTNYLGPGTRVTTNIVNDVQPTSYIDGLARQHDIDYMLSSGSYTGAVAADIKAILGSYAEISLQSIALRLGLSARLLANTLTFGQLANYNLNLPNMSHEQTQQVGQLLNDKISEKNEI